MDIERAATFGLVGAIGVILISLGTAGLIWIVWANRITGEAGDAIGTILLMGVAGTTVTILFLFVVIGTFIDRELEARGIASPEE